jgi:hypothetical protein
MLTPVIQALKGLRQKDSESKARLDYRVSTCLKKKLWKVRGLGRHSLESFLRSLKFQETHLVLQPSNATN